MSPPRHARARGFTLVELMTVVAIVAVLAVLATVSYRKFITSARGSEAVYMVGSIRSAEESYKAETLTYLDVSTSDNFYPTGNTPSKMKYAWDQPTTEKWKELGARSDGPVLFGYKVHAGGSGTITPPTDLDNPFTDAATEPWYWVEAKGDVDGNGVFSYALGSSFTGEIYIKNEGE